MTKWERTKQKFLDFNDKIQEQPDYKSSKKFYDEVLDNNITVVFGVAINIIKQNEQIEEYEICSELMEELKFLYSNYFDIRFEGKYQDYKEHSFNELYKHLIELDDCQ